MKIKPSAFAAIQLFLGTAAAVSSPRCRCRPSELCWPTAETWQSLNASIDGNLVAVRPFADVCHDPTYNADKCQVARRMSNNSLWLSANPGAVQIANWASWPQRNETCYVDTARSVPCGQGRISLYSVVARKAEHIQAAVRFVKRHNIRLAIKNTGHCFLGRSVAPDSLQILTHNLKSIDFVDNFKPQGCTTGRAGYGSAVTIGAGVQLKDLYTALGQRNLTAVIGASHTVGAAGGYIQGGGHSPLGPWKGMAVDNALEFTVVTAKGDIVVANDFQNSDLFWALRGGGGGSWGVVLNVTIRTFPDPPVAVQSLTVSTANYTGFWNFVEEFHAQLPAVDDAGGSGYYFLSGAAAGNVSNIRIALFFVGHTNETAMAKVMDPLIQYANETLGSSSVVSQRSQVPAFKYVIDYVLLPGDSDTGGFIARIGSRLVSRRLLSRRTGAAALMDSFKQFFAPGIGAGATITGHVVAGGQVARNAGLDVAVNPAWRRTLTHLTGGLGWPSTATVEEQRAVERLITDVAVPLFSRLEPDMGAYLNEADASERDFQRSFWGDNYPRLRKVKKRWDPEGIFISRKGVGSEDWDEDGLCRV